MFDNIIFSSIKRFIRLLSRSKYRTLVVIFALVLVASFTELFGLVMIIPVLSIALNQDSITENIYVSYIYNFFEFPSYKVFILFLCASLLIVFFLKSGFRILINYYQLKSIFSILEYLKKETLKNYFRRDFIFFKHMNSNIIVRNINQSATQIVNRVFIPIVGLTSNVIINLAIIISILFYNTGIIIILITVIVFILAIFNRLSVKENRKLGVRSNNLLARMNKILYEMIFGYIDVKITRTEQRFFKLYKKKLLLANQFAIKTRIFQLIPEQLVQLCLVLTITITISYTVFFLEGSNITILLSVLGIAAYKILPTINKIGTILVVIQNTKHHFDIMEDALLTKPSLPSQSTETIHFNKCISLKNISFSYPYRKKFTLTNINFEINKGETVGFIGKSGAGKTTLINILLRFLKEKNGGMWIDNLKLEDEHIESWRNLIGYVQQDVFILDGTLKENIAFGIEPEKINEERIYEVVESASLTELIKELPEGINTIIGERGVLLSGGQRQRIGIARAIYSEVKIILFDEATSALDSETEREITESIKKISDSDISMCIIAHRITTLKYCDKIIKMKDGCIERITTYKELLSEENF